ncbi:MULTISPECIES: hypothetical protein [unclassified Streptomyces]|uniref:hypothetical protein n=1 Tax=unclassified Streptomyces TaxID=2593676 RepID=UPI002E2DD271|nr:hypothetical protein [Streptomyces sp. NBC_00228]
MFSAPEGASRHANAGSPPPATNPFQAPDFGEDETLLLDDGQTAFSDMDEAYRRAG